MTNTGSSIFGPTADRDLILVGALTTVVAAATGLCWVLMLSLGITSWLAGGSWQVPAPATWPTLLPEMLGDPLGFGPHLRSPWATGPHRARLALLEHHRRDAGSDRCASVHRWSPAVEDVRPYPARARQPR